MEVEVNVAPRGVSIIQRGEVTTLREVPVVLETGTTPLVDVMSHLHPISDLEVSLVSLLNDIVIVNVQRFSIVPVNG